jgi:hypothetical protein
MDKEPKDNSINKLAWSVLIVAGLLLASVLACRWYSHTTGTSSTETEAGASVDGDGAQPAPMVINLNTPPPPVVASTPPPPHTVVKPSHVLDRDPGVIQRQAEIMMKQSAASEASTVGPSKLALTPEEIKDFVKSGNILQ